MATIKDNIIQMAELVAKVKRDTKLTEASILRIVDMNFALAQSSGAQSLGGDEEFPTDMPEDDGQAEGQLLMFPDAVEGDEEVLAGLPDDTTPTTEEA